MTTETFVMVLLTNMFTLTLSTMLYASRVYEIRAECQERIAQLNHDYTMQREIYGQVRIEDLLGRESFGDTDE